MWTRVLELAMVLGLVIELAEGKAGQGRAGLFARTPPLADSPGPTGGPRVHPEHTPVPFVRTCICVLRHLRLSEAPRRPRAIGGGLTE